MNYLYFQLKLLKEKQKKKMHDIKNIRQNFEEFNNCIAAMAIMAYVVADMEERLPR